MPGPIGVLDDLTPEQEATLLGWLDEGPTNQAVVLKVAAPPPEGFGIQTHVTSLRRFHARKRLEERFADLELAREHAKSKGAEQTFLAATENILAERAFQYLTDPALKPSQFAAVSKWFLKLREHELRREELRVQAERLEIHRKKAHFIALRAEAQAKTAHEEQKISAARTALFQEENA